MSMSHLYVPRLHKPQCSGPEGIVAAATPGPPPRSGSGMGPPRTPCERRVCRVTGPNPLGRGGATHRNIVSTHWEKTMGCRAANASGSQWISRDRDGKGKGEGTSRNDRRNGFQRQSSIQRGMNQCQQEGPERNPALRRKVKSLGASEGRGYPPGIFLVWEVGKGVY